MPSSKREVKKEKGPTKVRKPIPAQWRKAGKIIITILFSVMIIIMILARVVPEVAAFSAPENNMIKVIAPIQGAFSSVTSGIISYLRNLKYRANLELELNRVTAENDILVRRAMLADEYEHQLIALQSVVNEISLNRNMQPIMATVIGTDELNYTATLTINRGKQDGVEDMMAVTINGALVGYTIETKETTAHVKAVIDTDASVPALIQTTRDEGNIRGTLGIDGTAMCRMYHVDDYIPRPGDIVVTSGKTLPIPKGIPIGTVQESTRGMDANKQYIVVKPLVDFKHIENVIVYRYQPIPAIEIYDTTAISEPDFLPLDTPRPMPTIQVGVSSIHAGVTLTPDEIISDAAPTPSPVPSTTLLPSLAPLSTMPTPELNNEIIYHDPNASPSPTPEATATSSPEPTRTVSISDLTLEDDQ